MDAAFGLTCQYADPMSYGTKGGNWELKDWAFPLMIFAYVYYHRAESWTKEKEKAITSDHVQGFQHKLAKPLEIDTVVQGSKSDAEFTPGAVTVVIFWASWCNGCKKALAALHRLHTKYADKGVTFIALSQDKPADVKKVLSDVKMCSFTFATESGKNTLNYMVEYDVSDVPHCFIVGKTGKVSWHGHPNNMDSILHVTAMAEAQDDDTNEEKEEVGNGSGSDSDWQKVNNSLAKKATKTRRISEVHNGRNYLGL